MLPSGTACDLSVNTGEGSIEVAFRIESSTMDADGSGIALVPDIDRFVRTCRPLNSTTFPYRNRTTYSPYLDREIALTYYNPPDDDQLRELADIYSDWSFSVAIHPSAPFIAVSISPDATALVDRNGGFPDTPKLHTTKGDLYLFSHPPYSIPQRSTRIDGITVRLDGEYIIVPGPARMATHQDWEVTPDEVSYAQLPAWAHSWISTIEWDRVERSNEPLDRYLLKFYTPHLYGVADGNFMWRRLNKGLERMEGRTIELNEFLSALESRGIYSTTVGDALILCGIRREEP